MISNSNAQRPEGARDPRLGARGASQKLVLATVVSFANLQMGKSLLQNCNTLLFQSMCNRLLGP